MDSARSRDNKDKRKNGKRGMTTGLGVDGVQSVQSWNYRVYGTARCGLRLSVPPFFVSERYPHKRAINPGGNQLSCSQFIPRIADEPVTNKSRTCESK